MGKKNTNAAAKAAKKAKAQAKTERKEKKKVLGGGKAGGAKGKGKAEDDDEDLEAILDKMRRDWEEAHTVTEEISSGPPSRRANATLTPCPATGGHLWMFGGEFYSEDNKAYFYNDTFRYTPEKDEWRKYVSPTAPGPRSAHALVGSPIGGGKLFMFGGEFSSLNQTSFHHYRDFWCFDIPTHSWERIETKGSMPSARSGHRMAIWKHFIVLFGGFYDPGITTRYHNDLWIFDTQEYVWRQVEFREGDSKPSPRSGFSFLPTPEGVVLHGGYCKEYKKGQRPVGVMLEDTWVLKLTLVDTPSADTPSKNAGSGGPLPITAKWERRKRPSDAFAPSLRSGCTMTLWVAKQMGVMFGGVTDEEEGEEGLRSRFWDDMFGYQLGGKGRWVSFTIKVPKQKGGKAKKKDQPKKEEDSEDEWGDLAKVAARIEANANAANTGSSANVEKDSPPLPLEETKKAEAKEKTGHIDMTADVEDPLLTTPIPRYNTMLAVLKNTLYIYGGIFEKGSHEYTLDDFYSIQLDKVDRFICLKPSDVVIPEGEESSSSEEDGDDDDDEDYDEDDNFDIKYEDDEEGEGEKVNDDSDEEDGEDGEGSEGRGKKRKKDVTADEAGDESDMDGDDESDPGKPKEKERRKTRKERKLEQAIAASKAAQGIAEAPEPEEEVEVDELRKKATGFMGLAKDATRSEEEVLSTPLPGETLALFYARSRVYWAQRAQAAAPRDENRPKELRRIAFSLASDRYEEYKPLLEEVEKILAEAGLDEEEMRRVGAGGGTQGKGDISRNRRSSRCSNPFNYNK
ncbi:galactose oxidase, partial [Coprinellus micaceus]